MLHSGTKGRFEVAAAPQKAGINDRYGPNMTNDRVRLVWHPLSLRLCPELVNDQRGALGLVLR